MPRWALPEAEAEEQSSSSSEEESEEEEQQQLQAPLENGHAESEDDDGDESEGKADEIVNNEAWLSEQEAGNVASDGAAALDVCSKFGYRTGLGRQVAQAFQLGGQGGAARTWQPPC